MAEPSDRRPPDPGTQGPAPPPGSQPESQPGNPPAEMALSEAPDAAPAAEAEWRRPQRPAFKPEEGAGDRSDWASLAKAALLILLPIAIIAWLLTG